MERMERREVSPKFQG